MWRRTATLTDPRTGTISRGHWHVRSSTDATAELADALDRALQSGDLEAADQLYAPDLVVWHNTDRVPRDKQASLATLSALHQAYPTFRVDDVRRDYLPDGYLQRTTFRLTDRSGSHYCLDAAMRVWIRDGRIVRIEEYADSDLDAHRVRDHQALARSRFTTARPGTSTTGGAARAGAAGERAR
ncbi:MAG: nuclear transport factor 2 family protein [Frankiaceae bacterium]